MKRPKMLWTVVALSVVACRAPTPREAPRRPNVVLMMADDLASNDLSCYGGRNIETPCIDRLAARSLRLTSYYAGSTVCTPSRMALLSGAYPARLGWRWGVLGYGFPPKTGMSADVYTIAEAFRDAGYYTAMTGKWHLGDQSMEPGEQGFSSSLYIRMSNNQNRDMYRDGALVEADWDNRTLTEAFTREAIRVIEADRDEPFFLYVPFSAPHFPAAPHPAWAGRSGDGRAAKYKDVVEELDARVGQLLDALAASGKADDTIVIFTSDNGRQSGQEAAEPDPLYRGKKWQSLEGGTRVPCIVHGPGRVQARHSDAVVSAMDLFPTLASACGVKLDLPDRAQQLDGVDLWPLFTGSRAGGAAGRAELLYWHGKGQATALRSGRWKLRFHAGKDKPEDPALTSGPELYDLDADVLEREDVSAAHPDVVRSMMARARALLEGVYAEQVPVGTTPDALPTHAPVAARDVWGPWLDAAAK